MTPDIYDVLNYPERGNPRKLKKTFDNLGIELIPFGKKRIFGVPVLGKGWSSVVIYGVFKDREVAVKVQRTDSNRISLQKEASFLKIVNKYNIGPTLYHGGENFLIMEYIKGVPIREAQVEKEHVLSFLKQCHNLDVLKIDHGQVQGGKHLLIGEKCWIIDFEKAGYRTPRNVSSLVSELFLKKTHFARRMKSTFHIDTDHLIEAVHTYKQGFDIEFVLNALNLH